MVLGGRASDKARGQPTPGRSLPSSVVLPGLAWLVPLESRSLKAPKPGVTQRLR